MRLSTSARFATFAAVSALSVGVLAGCSGDDPATSPSASVGATEQPTYEETTASPSASASATSEPTPSVTAAPAEGSTRVESREGTMSAEVPNAWQTPDQAAVDSLATDETISDVLGAWQLGTPEDESGVVVVSQPQSEDTATADAMWETSFAGVTEQDGIEVVREDGTTAAGDEILYVTMTPTGGQGGGQQLLFFVLGDDEVVTGIMAASTTINPDDIASARTLAESVEFAS